MQEPLFAAVLTEAERTLREQGRAALCQIVRVEGSTPGKPGWKLLVRPDGSATGNLGGGAFEALVQADARAKLREERPQAEVKRYYFTEQAVKGEATGMVCGGLAEVFLEVLTASPVLLVCGGGPVGQAVAQAGRVAGFEILVVDDRPEFVRPELFPAGVRALEVPRAGAPAFLAPWRERELYVASVSRCWETDVAGLASVLGQAPPRLRYLGLMGSRRKVERVRRELRARGLQVPEGVFHAPIGLAIGGTSPGEIAISILAEVVAVRNGKPATVAV
jgi:xanthine dehydrogenase accessory factor